MGSIKTLNGDRFHLKSATKFMEDLDVSDETKSVVWNNIQNSLQEATEFLVLSAEDDCDIVLINMGDKGIAIITVEGGYGMFQPTFLSLTGKSMKATLDKDGKIHVFVVRDERLWHVQEKAPRSSLFSSPEEIVYTRPKGFNGVQKLLLYHPVGAEDFVVGVVSKVGNASYWVSWRLWESQSSFNLVSSSFSSSMLDFSGASIDELNIECLSGTYTSYSIPQRKNRFSYLLELPEGYGIRQIYPNDAGLFALLESGNGNLPVQIRPDEKLEKAYCTELAAKGDYHSLSMHTDEKNQIYMALSGAKLNYLSLTATEQGYKCEEMMPLDKSCTHLSFNSNAKCQRIFYFLEDKKIHVLENQDDVTWMENVLDVLEEGEVRRIPCYSTEMTFLRPDNHLAPLQDIEVTLWAESRTYIETVQGILKLDTDIKATLHTDMNGKIAFKQYTNGLDVPVIYASLPSEYCNADEAIAISQFADIHESLSGITSRQLLDAQQTDSMSGVVQPFLPDEHRNENTAKELASGIQELMKIKPEGDGLRLMKRSQLHTVSGVFPTDGLPSWSMDFSSGHPVYTHLSDEDAEREIQQMKSRVKRSGNGFFSKVRDFFRSVVKGFISVVKIVIKGIKAVVEFVLDGVKMIFEAVITVVQEIFHFVEMVFAAILIFFVTIFAWLASLFIWSDVMRTKQAIKESFSALMDLLPNHLMTVKTIFESRIGEIDAKISNCIDVLMEQLGADTTIGGYTETNVPPERENVEYELSNNVLMDKFNASVPKMYYGPVNAALLEAGETNVLDDFIESIKRFVNKIGDNPAFQDAVQFFQDAFSDMDKFLSSVLCGTLSVIKGVIHLVLDSVNMVFSAMIDIFRELQNVLLQIFNSKIKIPFFSALYKSLTGDELSIINFVSFLLSLPVVLTHKVIYQKAPFATDEEVADFVEDVRRSLGTVSGRGLSAPRKYATIFTVLSAMSAYLLCLCNMTINLIPDDGNCPDSASVLDWMAVVLECFWMASCLPVLSETDPSEYAYFAWAYFLLGAVVDGILTYVAGKYVDKVNYGRYFLIAYGVGHMGTAIYGLVRKTEDETELSPPAFTGELCGSITELSKGLLLLPSALARKFVAVIDGIGAFVIPPCIIFSSNKNNIDL